MLVRSLMLGACELQLIASSSNGKGVAARIRLNSFESQARLYENEPQVVARLMEQAANYRTAATEQGIAIPELLPDLTTTPLYVEKRLFFRVADAMEGRSNFAAILHITEDIEGTPVFHTQIANPELLTDVWYRCSGGDDDFDCRRRPLP